MLDFKSQNKISAQTQIVTTKVTMKTNKGTTCTRLSLLCAFGCFLNHFLNGCFGKSMGLSKSLGQKLLNGIAV